MNTFERIQLSVGYCLIKHTPFRPQLYARTTNYGEFMHVVYSP